MRDRHFPRVCRSCQAPMARQEDTCWRCHTEWATEEQPRAPLRVIPGGAPTPAAGARPPRPAIAGTDADRWIGEGGSL
jgi:hypothetical protein